MRKAVYILGTLCILLIANLVSFYREIAALEHERFFFLRECPQLFMYEQEFAASRKQK
jgi:hypothetical protein